MFKKWRKLLNSTTESLIRLFFWSLWKVYYPASVCSLIPTDRVLYYHNCSTGGVWCYGFCPVVGEWPHFFNINRKWTFRQWNMAISLYLFAILFCHLISPFDSNVEFSNTVFKSLWKAPMILRQHLLYGWSIK